jgi:hypothetical protein
MAVPVASIASKHGLSLQTQEEDLQSKQLAGFEMIQFNSCTHEKRILQCRHSPVPKR